MSPPPLLTKFVCSSHPFPNPAILSPASLEQVEMAMSGTKFEVVKFDGTKNFGLWQTRVKDLLAQQGILKALWPQKSALMKDED
ncbi:hypothetical protein Sango_1606800 [Sesamum angolense]|uniref:Uncharacterized protein n=1 Tax=Sesamum angolense TaxID=2727404 RepID=A0AAE1WJD5_9LAMI|nr:hypothetical protein Sango_1606800 [Sesamum angolense]